MRHGHGQLYGLASGFWRIDREFLTDQHLAAHLLDAHHQRLVVHADMTHDGIKRMAQCGLVAQQQTQWAQVGESP